MFMGQYNHSIDEKGRLIIPVRFRDELGENFVLTRGLDTCLAIYPKKEWDKLEAKLRSLPLTNKSARTTTRFLVSAAAMCELDKQGRILVPAALREFAGLDREVVLMGSLDRIEIWDKSRWDDNGDFDDMDDITKNLQDCGVMI